MRIDEKLQAVEGDRFLKTEWTLFGVDRSELKPMLAAFENMHAHALSSSGIKRTKCDGQDAVERDYIL